MSPSPTAATGSLAAAPLPVGDEPRLERPVLTVTGAVGLLLGSLAWALTGQFAAAPLVFVGSLTTALALAAVLEDRSAAADAAIQTLSQDLRATRSRLDVLEQSEPAPAAPGGRAQDWELNDLVLRGAAGAEAAAERGGVTLRTEPSELYLAVHADADLFERSFASLLSHAISASPVGGVVSVGSRLEGDRAIAEVECAGSADGGVRFSLSLPFGHRSGRPSPRRPRGGASPAAAEPARSGTRNPLPV
ncbi:hypothetical protein [Alienimonas sp. DA493]|uniref:hypothetical protein n=1 Tax=Alienimonas sp. DA493 TaxID=3373605 RepID=UPI003753FCE5